MKPIWTYSLTWFAVIAAALLLAVAAPRERGVMGRLPGAVGQKIESRPAAASADGNQRMLALVTFRREQRKEVDSWISGLQLKQPGKAIAWVRMPVVHDAGDAGQRAAAEGRLMAHYASDEERANLLPVFIDRKDFVESTGVHDTESAYVLVINRNGEVLARVPGEFDESKAEAVRDLLQQGDL